MTDASIDPPITASARCFGDGDPLYENYHDTEGGVPVHGEHELLERLALEGFQSGLSWLTVLRKREAFRSAFAGFDAETVAAYGPGDVERLLQDASIIRNRQKIEATLTNARALVALHDAGGSLDQLVWSFAPEPRGERPTSWTDVPAKTPESLALSKALKKAGFVFVGPITAYATMQACGLVDDHLATCPVVLAHGSGGPETVGATA
jgi:DNA-3-methyladenine glycosylase I